MDWAELLACDLICEVLDAPKNGYRATRESIAAKLRELHDTGHSSGYKLASESRLSDWLGEKESGR